MPSGRAYGERPCGTNVRPAGVVNDGSPVPLGDRQVGRAGARVADAAADDDQVDERTKRVCKPRPGPARPIPGGDAAESWREHGQSEPEPLNLHVLRERNHHGSVSTGSVERGQRPVWGAAARRRRFRAAAEGAVVMSRPTVVSRGSLRRESPPCLIRRLAPAARTCPYQPAPE